MNNLFEVREFDIIASSAERKDDTSYRYLPPAQFAKLVRFVQNFSGEEDSSDVLNFLQLGYSRHVGQIVRVKNYVGLIQVDNTLQLQVYPKISFGDGDDTGYLRTKKVFMKMLCSMKDFPSKVFSSASLKVERMSIFELFISMYIHDVRQLVRYGIKSGYVAEEGNLCYYKGKLKVSQHIKENIAHKERFYLAYDEFCPDCAENALLKATLQLLQKITTSAENAKEIRQLLVHFEMVHASINYAGDFAKAVITRANKHYKGLLQWSAFFLYGRSFTVFAGRDTAKSLLFPMETVYERYVAYEMQEVMGDSWEIAVQKTTYHLFTEPDKKFALRPDIILKKRGGYPKIILMDTKWKHLTNAAGSSYGISQSDMYQMYAYSKKFDASDIWLLYPMTYEFRAGNDLDIKFDSGDGTVVHVYFVDVAEIGISLSRLKERLETGG